MGRCASAMTVPYALAVWYGRHDLNSKSEASHRVKPKLDHQKTGSYCRFCHRHPGSSPCQLPFMSDGDIERIPVLHEVDVVCSRCAVELEKRYAGGSFAGAALIAVAAFCAACIVMHSVDYDSSSAHDYSSSTGALLVDGIIKPALLCPLGFQRDSIS